MQDLEAHDLAPHEGSIAVDRRGAERVRRLLGGGIEWHVREVATPADDRVKQTSLVFESPEAMRRVKVFPANWSELTDAELYALSFGR